MAKKIYLAGFAAAGLAAGVLAVTMLAGPAPVSANEPGQGTVRETPRCLDGRNVGRKHVVDDKTLLVYDVWGNPYKLGTGGPCRSMDDYSQIGFEFNGSDQICGAHDAKIIYSQNGFLPARCVISSFQAITREEAAKLDAEG